MKWVYKLKEDGRARARLVVLGYHQVLGVDYMESHAPVADDSTLRILLIISMSQTGNCGY